ncbi:MAG: hypothetical protein AAF560_22180 [Acidobacteriota bacterium]
MKHTTQADGAEKVRDAMKRLALLAVAASLVTLSLPSDIAEAACNRGPVGCTVNTIAGTKMCTATLQCASALKNSEWTVRSTAMTNIIACDPTEVEGVTGPTTFLLMATASTTAPTARLCGWEWNTRTTKSTGNVSISTADGLPVELMDFSVESADEE